MLCPNCGKNMSDDTKFCTACGSPMATAQSAPAVQPQTQAQPAAQPQATQFDATPAATPAPVFASQSTPNYQTDPQSIPAAPAQLVPKSLNTLKSNSPLTLISPGAAVIALVLAIFSFVSSDPGTGKLKIVDGGTATITIKAKESTGKLKVLPENNSYIVIATPVGGDNTFADVMYNSATGELIAFARHVPDTDKDRSINWVAYSK